MKNNREKRIGKIGDRPFGAGYMRDVNRRYKALKAAVVGRKTSNRQLRLPGF